MADGAAVEEGDRTSEVTAFGEFCEWRGVMSSDRARWLRARRELVTASDVAAILGEDLRRSALDVYADKILPAQDEPEPLGLDDPRFWGAVLEQPILRAVAERHEWAYRAGGALLRSRRHAWLGATLDAEIDRGAGWLELEGKTSRMPREWSEDEGRLPAWVLVQVQAQLLVIGQPAAVVFALLQGSRPCLVEVEASPEFQELIIEETGDFWRRVESLDPPPPTAKSAAAIRRLHPVEDGSVVELSAEALEWTREAQAIAERITALDARRESLRNAIKMAIGGATYGVLPDVAQNGKRVWKFASVHRAEHVVPASTSRYPLLIKELPRGVAAVATTSEVPRCLPAHEPVGSTERAATDDDNSSPIRMKRVRRRTRR